MSKPAPSGGFLELGKLDNVDAQKDRKHNLPGGVHVFDETDGKTVIDLIFCKCCGRMSTGHEMQRYGCCPRCRGHEWRGGYETPFESLKLRIWIWTNNWRVTGKWRKDK